MSTSHLSTAIAHLFSAGASIWALNTIRTSIRVPLGTFGSFLINSALGVLTYVEPRTRRVYGETLFLSQCVGLPCTVTQMCLKAGVRQELAYLPIAFALVPVTAHIMDNRREHDLLDILIFGNLVTAGYFSYMKTNHYGFAMIASYAINHFILGTSGLFDDTSIPSLDLFMYGLCFFDYFAIRALLD